MDEPLQDELPSELITLLNRHSRENMSNTPDFILARYMMDCLRAFEAATNWRERWYGRLTPVPADSGALAAANVTPTAEGDSLPAAAAEHHR